VLARLGVTAAVTAAMALLPAGSGSAVTKAPGVRLLSVLPHVTAVRFPGDPQLFLSAGLYVAATNGPFELDAVANRGAVSVYPTRRDSDGAHRGKALSTPSPVSISDGLPGFFRLTLTDATGRTLLTSTSPFCPGGWYGQSRVDASGPDRPTFPYYCGSQLTKGAVWGIDRGWASPVSLGLDGSAVPDGDYTLKAAVDSSYVKQLGIDGRASSVTFAVTVTTDPGGCPPDLPCKVAAQRTASSRPTTEGPAAGPRTVRRSENDGDHGTDGGGGLPNLAALPAHNLAIENAIAGRDYLDFGATIWNAGPGPFVVEGFRQGSSTIMPATQFIYENGAPSRSATVGQFEFDRRPGHDHWHFEDVAQYDLLDANGSRVLLSGKQSFCLAPTDPIDLTLPGAEFQPDRAGLWSACSGEDSIWLREVMPAGWGDTYYQGVAGQSFDITDVPNGRYQLRVTTDPFHKILETSYADNTSLLTVDLAGTAGNRTVSTS
jgi:hypothetical protein